MQVAELPRLHRGPLATGRPEIGVSLVLVAAALVVVGCRRAFRVDAEQELDELGERVEVEELWLRIGIQSIYHTHCHENIKQSELGNLHVD